MSAPTRRLAVSRLRLLRASSPSARAFATSAATARDDPWPQRTPLGEYYTSILIDPIPYPFTQKPEEPPSSADPSVLPVGQLRQQQPTSSSKGALDTRSAADPLTPQEKARIIFGSRLTGPQEQADRLALKNSKSTYIAGVLVPPQPEEPDNCCMSGCVNCVWDGYREEMEEWSAKKNEAQARLSASSGSMDSDGGGSDWNRADTGTIAKDMWDDGIYQSVPVGIREFMKQEKRLKEKHAREGTSGG